MKEYIVEFDTFEDGCFGMGFRSEEFKDILEWTKERLKKGGGGHADIYDEEDNLVEDVEV